MARLIGPPPMASPTPSSKPKSCGRSPKPGRREGRNISVLAEVHACHCRSSIRNLSRRTPGSLTPRACDALITGGKKSRSSMSSSNTPPVSKPASPTMSTPAAAFASLPVRKFSRAPTSSRGPYSRRQSLHGSADIPLLRRGQILIGFGDPLTFLWGTSDLADAGVSFFAMEIVPRITRAQTMDALSSMASIAGYEAVLIAASALPKMFP